MTEARIGVAAMRGVDAKIIRSIVIDDRVGLTCAVRRLIRPATRREALRVDQREKGNRSITL